MKTNRHAGAELEIGGQLPVLVTALTRAGFEKVCSAIAKKNCDIRIRIATEAKGQR
jgi:hypothetical protein